MRRSAFPAALAALFVLASCGTSTTEKDFLCPAQTGQPCTTIADADGTVTAGGKSLQERTPDTLADGLSQTPLISGKGSKAAPASGMGDGGFAYEANEYRLPEKVGTLWVAPHAEGEALFEATYVHFLIMPAAWGDRP
jgi:conjugal transfer pilus assembly protein TraV